MYKLNLYINSNNEKVQKQIDQYVEEQMKSLTKDEQKNEQLINLIMVDAIEKYISEDYFLFFDYQKPIDHKLEKNVLNAHKYLKNMDKTRFSTESFLQDIESELKKLVT